MFTLTVNLFGRTEVTEYDTLVGARRQLVKIQQANNLTRTTEVTVRDANSVAGELIIYTTGILVGTYVLTGETS